MMLLVSHTVLRLGRSKSARRVYSRLGMRIRRAIKTTTSLGSETPGGV